MAAGRVLSPRPGSVILSRVGGSKVTPSGHFKQYKLSLMKPYKLFLPVHCSLDPAAKMYDQIEMVGLMPQINEQWPTLNIMKSLIFAQT